jgi:hypothetical protein
MSFGFISLFGLGVCAVVFHACIQQGIHILLISTCFELCFCVDATGVHVVPPKLKMRRYIAKVVVVTGWAQRDVTVGDHDVGLVMLRD